jgi:hypothetical protein
MTISKLLKIQLTLECCIADLNNGKSITLVHPIHCRAFKAQPGYTEHSWGPSSGLGDLYKTKQTNKLERKNPFSLFIIELYVGER